jgi:maltose O-acetyltransferase
MKVVDKALLIALKIYERLLTKLCTFLVGTNPVAFATKEALDKAMIRTLKTSLRSCGERLSIQFPVTITGLNSVEFGEDVSLATYVHIWGDGGVTIGNRVMIGTHTSITSLTHDHNQEVMFNTIVCKPVVIEDDVWIGSNCVILPGVKIGRGAVVGAGSVVTGNVEPNSIVVGVPATHIKYREINRDTGKVIA